MRYLKKKGDPDHCYHVWTEGLAARDDMFDFVPKDTDVVTAVPVVEAEPEVSVPVPAPAPAPAVKLPGRPKL